MDQPKRLPDWMPTVIGSALSIALGAVFYFRTDMQAAFAVFAGLLGVSIALLLELLLQVRRATAAEIQRNQLMARIESVDWLSPILHESLTALQAVRVSYQGTKAVDLTRIVFEECLERLRDLQRGFLSPTYSQETDLLDNLTRHATHSIVATSGQDELRWWHTPDAAFYLQRQAEAIERGVTIERIFAYQEWTDLHETVTKSQQDAGVKVSRVQAHRIRGIRNTDLIVWDGRCGFVAEYNSAGGFTASRFYFSAGDIRQLENNFLFIKALAEPLPSHRPDQT